MKTIHECENELCIICQNMIFHYDHDSDENKYACVCHSSEMQAQFRVKSQF